MFESLQDNLSSALRALRGKGKLTEANMREGLLSVQQALLEADVSFPVVKEFMDRVNTAATGEAVLKSLDPSQQVVGIVYQELVNLMGPVDHSLHLRGDIPVLMMCGLQGSGKTTTCGKLARMLKERGRKPLLVAADLQRPAAIDQLHVLGEQLGVAVYSDRENKDPVKVCQAAVKQAKALGADVVILDTAGRLHIDDELMQQLTRIDRQCDPQQVYLVVDGMTGQDAVNSAKAFNEALELDGVIMTKLDGDARGGAALSVKAVTGVPLKFIGTGEHLDALEEFHPDRMAERILGMGDIRSLVEMAQSKFDQDEMARQEEKLRAGEFTLDDFRMQLKQMAQPGLIQKMMALMPGMSGLREMMGDVDATKNVRRLMGIIDSMTKEERRNPTKVVDQTRRRRIAAGAGVEAHEVNELVKQYDAMKQTMTGMAGMGIKDRLKMAQQMQAQAMQNPGGMLGKTKKGTGKRLSTKEKQQMKKEREREMRRKKRGDGK
jgi:signal recognition particle subunit SRP54